jgi:uncharacterized membrane protein
VKITPLIIIALILATVFLSAVYYPFMPEQMASHWNERGEVDGTMPKFWGLFLMPSIMAFLAALLYLPFKIDPLRQNIMKFKSEYEKLIILLTLFLLFIHIVTILWNMGYEISIIHTTLLAMAPLIYYAGYLMERSSPNWFIGVRTPWTLSNETVWQKTNRLGGRLFRICAILCVISAFLPAYGIIIAIASLIISGAYATIYSYIIFPKDKN